ncbi:MAG: phytoene/squalene synthase family protein, partial [Planctomycetota bacterium]
MSAAGRGRLADADAVLREHGRTFTWARRFLGRRHAERATHLYAFCRYLDDVADEGEDREAAARALDAVREDLARGRSDDPFVAAFLAQLAGRPAARAAAGALIDGVSRDLRPVAFDSDRELMRYCYRVAGTVGVMMCEVLDQPDPAAAPFAVDLGIAM